MAMISTPRHCFFQFFSSARWWPVLHHFTRDSIRPGPRSAGRSAGLGFAITAACPAPRLEARDMDGSVAGWSPPGGDIRQAHGHLSRQRVTRIVLRASRGRDMPVNSAAASIPIAILSSMASEAYKPTGSIPGWTRLPHPPGNLAVSPKILFR